ncbi:MAG: lysophospholipid acyltransferase family protein [Pseudomonadota bacterium]
MSVIVQWLGSVIFTLWMFASVGVWSVVLVIAAPLPYRIRFAIARSWIRLIMASLKLLCGLDYRVIGREHIPDEAAVYLLKHSSAFETLAEIIIFPRQTWVLKRELKWIPIFGWALSQLKPIAINRGGGRNAVKQVIRHGQERLDEGINVMIFPEGTRVRHGETRRYGVSGAALAAASGRRIVPVAHNAGAFWPRRGIMKHRGTVTFVVGEPIDVGDRDLKAVNAEIQAWVEAEIVKMGGRSAEAAARAVSTR